MIYEWIKIIIKLELELELYIVEIIISFIDNQMLRYYRISK